MTAIVKLAVLRELVSAGSVRSVSILGRKGGWSVLVRNGVGERVLVAKDGVPRLFSNLESAAKVLRDVSISSFDVQQTNFQPESQRRARPALSTAMKEVHAAAEHDAWFRAKIRATRAAIADGSCELLDHNTVFKKLHEVAAQLDATRERAPIKRTVRTHR